ncbi:hypothetical protein [Rhizobium lusitanum]|uniref:hypothetical protein n=1 Tax=Rhizobium lusitanum TaxID=293958 RepID=UPI0013DB7A3E|nr:hypothetical protein [Rhizobium lusitanum]
MTDFWARFEMMKSEVLATDDGKLFASAGFELYANGGNCTAWRKAFGDGGYILITNDDGSSHHLIDTDDSFLIGFYRSEDDTDPGCSKGQKTAAEVIAAVERGPLEKIGVDVWIAGTIYVDAATDEEAAQIVKERYAGSRDSSLGYDLMSGEDFPMDGDDFMSPAITLYGLCKESELLPAIDPVRDAAHEMLAILSEIAALPGAAVEIERAGHGAAFRAALAKAEGRTDG